ncbi:acyl-CoA dehydrogenase family protein [uncultured Mycobacterium sp.]|uniref:acyl-CoA dehydrogenase family protein n=1 Tax=uncultured Mycobacterium sp. TaxID=171292 RepID=UPI0035C9E318
MPSDESWPMIEQAVFRLFDEIAGKHTVIGPRLTELGWSDIESEYPVEACELLFQAQGRSLAQTDCLDRVMLAELTGALDDTADAIVLPSAGDGCTPASHGDQVSGIVLGPLPDRVVVAVTGPSATVSAGVVDAQRLHAQRLDTFDTTVQWTRVSGPAPTELVEASQAWPHAVAAAQRALGTELVAISEQILRLAVEHANTRIQFGVPIGSFQSLRHALAEACAAVEGARSLLEHSWRYGGHVSAQAAKAAAGRAHRAVSGTAMQVFGAIGLTAEHVLHRYVSRGVQVDSLCGSYRQLETGLAEHLFSTTDQPLPPIVVCG